MADIQLIVSKVVKETIDTITLYFEPVAGVTYKSGQFLTFTFPINGFEERRSYSLCSAPGIDGQLAVSVKRVKGGIVSNYIHDKIKAGSVIDAFVPAGNFIFVPNSDQQRHLVLVAGGSGITPMLSIAKSALHGEPSSVVTIVYTNKNEENVIFKDQLEQLGKTFSGRLRVKHHFTQAVEEKSKGGFFGLFSKRSSNTSNRLDAKSLLAIFNELGIEANDPTLYYICGPSGLMQTCNDVLISMGVRAETIFKESFYLAPKSGTATGAGGTKSAVTIKLRGKEYVVDVQGDKSILHSALSQGIELPYSCQSGVCTACMGKCVEGKVVLEETDGLTEDQIRKGFVLTCVGHPKTDKVVIEID